MAQRLLLIVLFSLATCCMLCSRDASGAPTPPPTPAGEGVDVVEHLGASIPLDVELTDQDGKVVRLGDRLDGRGPVILVFMYHRCEMLCSVLVDSLARSLRGVRWTAGKEYRVLTVSIDPHDSPAIAARKHEQVLSIYGRSEAREGWTFLVAGKPENAAIVRLADAVGFRYRYDEASNEFAHPAAVFVLTPQGRIARYLYGIELPSMDLRLALFEASEGRWMKTIDRILLACFKYDPGRHRYGVAIDRTMKIGAVAIFCAVAFMLARLWRAELRKRAS